MFFVCHPKILHKHFLQFLLGVEIMVLKLFEDKNYGIMVCYGISAVINWFRIQLLDSGSFVSGNWIPDSNRIWDFGFLELHSRF